MGTKYYTRFLLQPADQAAANEYSGVVEVQTAQDGVMDSRQIEALLASSFDLEMNEVRLLNWSPLH